MLAAPSRLQAHHAINMAEQLADRPPTDRTKAAESAAQARLAAQ